jgi:hypothetical protein
MIRFSTAARNALAGLRASYTSVGTIAATAPAVKSFTDTASQFLIEGFRPGDVIISDVTNNVGLFTIVSLVAGTITTMEATALQVAGNFTLANVSSKGFKDLFHAGVLDIYSGSQPASADDVETGTKLLSITVSAGAVTPGTATNGLDFDDPVAGVISKAAAESWQDAGLASATAGWFRFYDNAYQTGADATYYKIRFDGSVGLTGSDLNLSDVAIVLGATTTIDTFQFTFPASP